jgi:hypothetical protein
METWKNACPGDLKRYNVIAGALEKHHDLLSTLFCTDRASLVTSPTRIKQQTGAYSSGEKVLIRAALDLWSGSGKLTLMELQRLDPQNFGNVITAFVKLQSL